mgnify:CR=1
MIRQVFLLGTFIRDDTCIYGYGWMIILKVQLSPLLQSYNFSQENILLLL